MLTTVIVGISGLIVGFIIGILVYGNNKKRFNSIYNMVTMMYEKISRILDKLEEKE